MVHLLSLNNITSMKELSHTGTRYMHCCLLHASYHSVMLIIVLQFPSIVATHKQTQ